MSKINQSTNLRVEDYPDEAKWIGRLFTVLNAFFTEINQIIDQNIDFATNIRSVTRDFDSSSLTFPLKFDWGYSQAAPADLRVTKAMAGSDAIALLPAWTYDASTKQISITSLAQVLGGVVGATSVGTRYRFTVRVTV